MSSFQYYDFQTVGRALSRKQQEELRAVSSRASISATRFTNVYNYGDLEADAETLVARFFDGSLYMASWGTYELMLRVPAAALKGVDLAAYCGDPEKAETYLAAHRHGSSLVLQWHLQEEGGEWLEEEPDLLGELLPLREELLAGDLRPLYLGWLMRATMRELEDSEQEPPVPPGLGALTPAQRRLAEFLRVDVDLLGTAAQASPAQEQAGRGRVALEPWLRALPAKQQADWLVRLATSPDGREELLAAHRQAAGPVAAGGGPRRTLAELREGSVAAGKRREATEARRRAQAQARAVRAAAAEREKRLKALAKREEEAWEAVEALAVDPRRGNYERAVAQLEDLRALARRRGEEPAFTARVERLKRAKPGRAALHRRLADAEM